MKRSHSLLAGVAAAALLALTLAPTSSTVAGEMMQMPDPITVKETLIDTKCYAMNAMNSGNDHMTPKGEMPGCATACAAMGIPVGVLDSKGNVTVLIAPAAVFSEHMAKTARVTGMPALGGGGVIANKVEVKDGGKWVEVKVTTMM